MAARKRSGSRRSAAKAKSKKATQRPKAKKAAARKKATARKVVARRKKSVPARKAPARVATPRVAPASPALAEIEQRIAIVRSNLRALMEQAAGTSGSGSEELLSDRIASEEAELQRLLQARDTMT